MPDPPGLTLLEEGEKSKPSGQLTPGNPDLHRAGGAVCPGIVRDSGRAQAHFRLFGSNVSPVRAVRVVQPRMPVCFHRGNNGLDLDRRHPTQPIWAEIPPDGLLWQDGCCAQIDARVIHAFKTIDQRPLIKARRPRFSATYGWLSIQPGMRKNRLNSPPPWISISTCPSQG